MTWHVQFNAKKRSVSIIGEPDINGFQVEIEIPEQNEQDAMHIASSLSMAKAKGNVLVSARS